MRAFLDARPIRRSSRIPEWACLLCWYSFLQRSSCRRWDLDLGGRARRSRRVETLVALRIPHKSTTAIPEVVESFPGKEIEESQLL